MLQNAARSSCELANPAQVRQIASQTGVLFSAGCGLLLARAPMISDGRGTEEQVAGKGAAEVRKSCRCAGRRLLYHFAADSILRAISFVQRLPMLPLWV